MRLAGPESAEELGRTGRHRGLFKTFGHVCSDMSFAGEIDITTALRRTRAASNEVFFHSRGLLEGRFASKGPLSATGSHTGADLERVSAAHSGASRRVGRDGPEALRLCVSPSLSLVVSSVCHAHLQKHWCTACGRFRRRHCYAAGWLDHETALDWKRARARRRRPGPCADDLDFRKPTARVRSPASRRFDPLGEETARRPYVFASAGRAFDIK